VGVCKFQEIQNLVKPFTIPFDETPIASVASDLTHCKPYDWVKSYQWVRTMTLWIVAIAIETMSNSNNKLGEKPTCDQD